MRLSQIFKTTPEQKASDLQQRIDYHTAVGALNIIPGGIAHLYGDFNLCRHIGQRNELAGCL